MFGRWREYRRSIEMLEARVRALEEAARRKPIVWARFEEDQRTREVRLHVKNEGASARFAASFSVYRGLAGPTPSPAFVPWTHIRERDAIIDHGHTAALSVAHLELSAWPIARWSLHAIDPSGARIDLPAAHASTIGGDPSDHAPQLIVEVVITTVPALAEGVHRVVLSLGPFAAERLVA